MSEFEPIPTHPRFQDLTGKPYGRWTVLGYAGWVRGGYRFWCQCSCGSSPKLIRSALLKNGHSTSCGCFRAELSRKQLTVHGGCGTKEYGVWRTMLNRCRDPKNERFSYYGGRGVVVCDRWLDFVNFLADMGPRPSAAHQLDRFPDNDGPYAPDNVRWATRKEQGRNKRNNRLMTSGGETLPLSAWAERLHVAQGTIRNRLRRGWSEERTLTEAIQPNRFKRP